MSSANIAPTPRRSAPAPAKARFSESSAWQAVGTGWRQLFGNYRQLGFSFEWHDFVARQDLDWARSFHPESLEICLNLLGRGTVRHGSKAIELPELSAGFYRQWDGELSGVRAGGERHQFLTIELSPAFLSRHFSGEEPNLHPMVTAIIAGRKGAAVAPALRLTPEHQHLMASLRHPPVFASAQRIWYQAKALEVMSTFLFTSPPENEFFCQRQKRVGLDRVERVISILKANIAEPPTLEALGKQVGCSPFYLSRIFSQQMGQTISQYLRQLRMERAAELLREGRLNVTQVAMEVGYSSSSHFSVAFHETFGCCPGLYPLPTLASRKP